MHLASFRTYLNRLSPSRSKQRPQRAGPAGRRPTRTRLTVEVLEDRWCPSTTRPITDFLNAQGTTSTAPYNFGVTGLPDEIAWTTASTTPTAGNGRLGGIDYTGQDAAFLGLNLGTTTSGTVSERPLPNGQARVTVNLTTHNAFAWAMAELPDRVLSLTVRLPEPAL